VENSKAIFVTTNNGLAKATRSFFQNDGTPGAVALCISDYALGNLLWLKNPTKAPDLPRRRLIADAMAAMEPPEALWNKYLVEIARLDQRGEVSPDDYLLLRHSVAAKATLMDLTIGDPAAFSQGTVAEVLEIAKRNVRADTEQQLEKERSRRIEAEGELAKRVSEEGERVQVVSSLSAFIASVATGLAFAIVLLALGIATLYSFPWQLPPISRAALRYLLTATQFALFIYLIASMVWGTTLQGLAQRFKVGLSGRLERQFRQWLRL
jgi:hypothetical protein